VLLEACSADGGLTLEVRVDFCPSWLVDGQGGTVEDKPVEVPATGALAGGDIGCSILEFAAAEGVKVDRVGVWREFVGVGVGGGYRFV